jgi:hypothetical protein
MKKTFKNKRRGQGSVEYILIIAAVVGVLFVFGKQFKEKIGAITNTTFGNVNSAVGDLSRPQ